MQTKVLSGWLKHVSLDKHTPPALASKAPAASVRRKDALYLPT